MKKLASFRLEESTLEQIVVLQDKLQGEFPVRISQADVVEYAVKHLVSLYKINSEKK